MRMMMTLSRNFKDLEACDNTWKLFQFQSCLSPKGDSTCYLSGNSLSYSGLVALPDGRKHYIIFNALKLKSVPRDVFNQPFTETDNLWFRTTTYHLSKKQILPNPSKQFGQFSSLKSLDLGNLNRLEHMDNRVNVFFIFIERQTGLGKAANKKN
ncbi:hypothetical protein CK203_106784 [Vitis vinifera]|uniref:Uncharacterized protein n=1 Tax=Vitis vinifera TaxID=29760 RepID=A0A438CBW8_VITVI|nr:hypothetical protein CK203_106784 [Vitis vinifera]